jgi:calcineurin-like phosphoesterase family protein
MIWLTSDWHFSHDRPFIWESRGFDNIQQMNEVIVTRHNSLVLPEDDVYVLGDLCLGGGSEEALAANKELIESMNGKLHIICGNHDTSQRLVMYESCDNVEEILGWSTMLVYKKYHLYLSHFPTITSNYDELKPLKAKVINICGHSHTKDKYELIKQNILSYHVETDSHNCYPVHIEKIIEDIKEYIK